MRILSVLFLINALLGLFLAVILFINSKKRINENIFLMLLLLIITGYQMKAVIVLEGYYSSFPFLIGFFLPLHFLLGPLFFYYVKFVIHPNFQLGKRELIHLFPAVICFITLLPLYLKTSSEKLAIYSAPGPGNFEPDSNKIYYYGLILISAIFYCWRSLKLIQSKSKSIDGRGFRSYIIKLKWLHKYTSAFLIFLLCFFISQLIFIFTDFYQFYVMLSTVLISSIMIHYVVYWSIKESRVTNSVAIKSEPPAPFQKRIPELKQHITDLLEKEKLYLKG